MNGPTEHVRGVQLVPMRHDAAELDLIELGESARWAVFAENERHDLDSWMHWRSIPRGERMAALYGFGEVRA